MRLPFRVDNVSQLKTIILHHIRGSQMVPDDECNKTAHIVFGTCSGGGCPLLGE